MTDWQDISTAPRDGWVNHNGGPCPVDRGIWLSIRFRDGEETHDLAACIPPAAWKHMDDESDIIAYKPESNQ